MAAFISILVFCVLLNKTLSQPCYPTDLPSALKLPVDKPYATSKNDFIVTFNSSPIEPKLTVTVPQHYVPERTLSKVTFTPTNKALVPNQAIPNLTSFIPSSECPAPKVAVTPKITLNPFVDSSCISTVPVSKPITSKNTYTPIFKDSSLPSTQPEYTTNIIPSESYIPTLPPISETFYSEANIPYLTSFILSSECPAPKVAATPKIALNPFVDSSCTSPVPVSEPIPSKNTYTPIFTDSSLPCTQTEYTTSTIPSGSYIPTLPPISETFSSEAKIPNLTTFILSSECPAPEVDATPKIALNPFVDSSCTSTVPVSEPIPSKNTYTPIFTDSSLPSTQPEYTTNIIPSGSHIPTLPPISETFSSEAKIPSLYNVPPVIYQRTAQDNSLAMSLANVLQLFILDKILQRLSPTLCQNSISLDSNIYSSYSDNIPETFNNNFNPYFVPQIENGVINANSYKYTEEPTNFIPWNIDTSLPCSYIEDTPTYYDHNLISTNVYDLSKKITNPYNNIQIIHNPIDTNVNAYPIIYENIAILPNTYVDTYISELTDCINTDLPIEHEIAEGIISESVTYDNSNVKYTHLVPTYEYISPQSVETIEECLSLPFAESSYNFIDTNPIIYDFVSPILTNPYNSPQLSPVSSLFPVSSHYPPSPYNEINSLPLNLELLMPSSIPLQLVCVCDIPRTLPELTLGVEPLFHGSYCEYM